MSDPAIPQRPARARAWLCVVAALICVVSLGGPIASTGIWDPPELRVIEFARRIALNLLGGSNLAIDGAENLVPIRAELGKGELPFTSIALGLRLFGLHDWAGRLPLVLWGLLGIAATYVLVARLCDRIAAALAAIALATMPLYFLQARTMLGDIVTMANLAIAVAGLGLAVFDRAPGIRGTIFRAVAFVAGAAGLLGGFWCRGALIGVAVPALGVGLCWLVLRLAGVTSDKLGDGAGVASLFLGAAFAHLGVRALIAANDPAQAYSIWLGSAANPTRLLPTFDAVLLQLGHALFPWSAVIPVAIGRSLSLSEGLSAEERNRELALRILPLTVLSIAFVVLTLSAPTISMLPFSAVAMFAIQIALLLRDFERGAPASRVLPMVAIAISILLLVDFKNFPEKGLSAFVVSDARFPESFKETAERLLKFSTIAFAGLFFFSLMEHEREPRFNWDEYGKWPRTLRTLWGGNLQFALLVLEAALIGTVLLGELSDRHLHLAQFERMGAGSRTLAKLGAVLLPVAVASPLAAMAVRDAFRSLFTPGFGSAKLQASFPRLAARAPSRAVIAAFAAASVGLVLSLAYYPALAAQISPKQVFESYAKLSRGSEPLGMIGTGAVSARYYAGRDVPSFGAVPSAFEWLMDSKQRRFLVIRASDLGSINSLYRMRAEPPRNLPVLDARSSEILLISNLLRSSEQNQNPLDAWLRTDPPRPVHVLDVNLGDKLDVIGWDVRALDGTPVSAVVPGRSYLFSIYFKVVAPITGSWETFIHIDGFQRRFNGDHPTLEGKYPFNLWHTGDYIVDRYQFALEPNFTAGRYRVYFGLFSGSRRLEVRRGYHNENRVEAGDLVVE